MSKVASSWKAQVISTKYFICINLGHYVIYLQNMKLMRSILWPGGAYTGNTYANKAKIMILYYDEIMNHEYIGSFWQCQMSQKPWIALLLKFSVQSLLERILNPFKKILIFFVLLLVFIYTFSVEDVELVLCTHRVSRLIFII